MKTVLALVCLSFCSSAALVPLSSNSLLSRTFVTKASVSRSSPHSSTTAKVLQPQVASSVLSTIQQPTGLKDNVVSCANEVAAAVKKEMSMTFGLLQSDIPVTIVLGTVSAVSFGLARSSALSGFEWVSLVFKALIWFFGYGYHFDIGNQITGVEEDKHNLGEVGCKANRPLATGAMSLEGAKIRHLLSGIYYMAVSWMFGGPELSLSALLWIVSSQLYNFHGWGDHFATKNYWTMATGSIAMLLGARTIAGEAASSVIPPILAAVWIGLCMDSQDLRDEAGDRLSGRRTTAVLLGLDKARKAYVGLAAVSTGLLMFIMQNCISWPDAIIVSGIVAHLVRTLGNETTKDDHKTYKEICLAGALFFCRSAFWAHSF